MAAEHGADREEPTRDVPNPGVIRTIMAVLGGLVAFLLVGAACAIVSGWLNPSPPYGTMSPMAGSLKGFLAACAAGYCTGRIAGRRSWLPGVVLVALVAAIGVAFMVFLERALGMSTSHLVPIMLVGYLPPAVVVVCWGRIGEAVSRRQVSGERRRLGYLLLASLCALVASYGLALAALGVMERPSEDMKTLEQMLAELKASGASMSLAEAAPEPVPDEENGALLYMQAFEELRKFEEQSELYDPEPVEPGSERPEAPTDELVRFFDESQAVYDLLRAAADRPRCRFPLNYADGIGCFSEHSTELRQCARYLRTRAIVMTRMGQSDEAMETASTLFDLAGSVREEPMLTSWLVTIALRQMALETVREMASTGRLEAPQLRALAQRVPWPDARQALARAYVGDRATGIRLFQDARQGKLDPWELVSGGSSSGNSLYTTPAGARALAVDELFYLEAMSRIIAMATLPYQQAREQMPDWEADVESPPGAALISMILAPSAHYITQCARSEADAAVSLTGLRLLAYRDETGRYPADLAELERADGQPLPPDPFTGAPLCYESREDGFLLYSYGPDEEDDAGEDDDVAWEMMRH